MAPLFAEHGVRVVALSKDTPELAAFSKRRDGLGFTLLSDPDLAVISAYGLVHHRGLPFTTFYVLGIPMGWPRGFEPMAIPTTLIGDETGTIRWIDQADDYRLRGDETRIRSALERVFTPR